MFYFIIVIRYSFLIFFYTVHITCYRCGKEYFVHQENLSAPKFEPGKGYGWWMVCNHCDYQWWQEQPLARVPAEGRHRPAPPPKERGFLRPPQSEEVEFTAQAQHRPRTASPHFKGAYTTSAPSRGVTFLWIIFFLCLITVLVLAYQHQEQLTRFFQKYITLSEKPKAPPAPQHAAAPPTPQETQQVAPPAVHHLLLENVKYGVQATESGEKNLVVLGEVFNEKTQVVVLNPLKIVALGPCTEGETPTHADNLCVRAEWSYEWNRPNILPGERLFFQTEKALTGGHSNIQRVEVTIP